MMNKQEVVFCKSIFEAIKNNFEEQEIWSSENYYKNLFFIKIKTLKSNKKIIEKCIKESKGFLKIFKQHIFNENLELLEENNEKTFFDDQNLNCLCNMSRETKDRIIHSDKKNYWRLIQKSEYKDDFEILGINRFVNPIRSSKLIASERNIEYNEGDIFNFIPVLSPYFRSTERLQIYDRYVRKKDSGFLNLNRILDLAPNLKICKIYTITYPNSEKNGFDIEFNELDEKLKSKYGDEKIELFASPKGKHRRKIITDDFEIKIDPGLDFVNEEFICEKNDIDIQIRKLNI